MNSCSESGTTRPGCGSRGKPASRAGLSGLVAVFGLGVFLGGCSTFSGLWGGEDASADGTIQPAANTSAIETGDSAENLYREAQDNLKSGSYRKAAKKFEEVERQHPYSQWARRGILMTSFAHYQRNAYNDAILAARRFITLYPGHNDAPYAYYLVALSYYEQITDVGRDQKITKQALDALTDVERRFPDSKYATDARQKAVLARDHLAGKEMKVGRYYLKKHAYVAAINRFRTVVTDYQTTSHTPEALMRLSEAYMALGIKAEAQTAAAVLGHNFPDSAWYQDAYSLLESDGLTPRENKGSWISRAWKSVNPF